MNRNIPSPHRILLASSASDCLSHAQTVIPQLRQSCTIVYVPTAATPLPADPVRIQEKVDLLTTMGHMVDTLFLEQTSPQEMKRRCARADILFVAGGNTFYLLQETLRSGFDAIIREHVAGGKMYIGSSAGALLVCLDISIALPFDNPDHAPHLKTHKGIGLVDFSVMPHWGDLAGYDKYMQSMCNAYEKSGPFILLRDNQYVYVEGSYFRIITVYNKEVTQILR